MRGGRFLIFNPLNPQPLTLLAPLIRGELFVWLIRGELFVWLIRGETFVKELWKIRGTYERAA